MQLVLQEEVSPGRTSAKRSQTTGHLLLTIPKARQTIVGKRSTQPVKEPTRTVEKINCKHSVKDDKGADTSLLEVDPNLRKGVDFASIVTEADDQLVTVSTPMQTLGGVTKLVSELTCEDSTPLTKGVEFVDDLDVPPLI